MSPTAEQYDSLLRHLRERIDEGCGETIYVVGMGSGKGHSLKQLKMRFSIERTVGQLNSISFSGVPAKTLLSTLIH